MRFAVQYLTRSNNTGLIIFSVDDLSTATIYKEELVTCYGHYAVFNLQELTEGTLGELYRLYPGVSNVTVRAQEISKQPLTGDDILNTSPTAEI